MITLICGDKKWKVSTERAESILRNPLNKKAGWELPANYELNKDGRITRIKTSYKRQAEREGAEQGDNTRTEA